MYFLNGTDDSENFIQHVHKVNNNDNYMIIMTSVTSRLVIFLSMYAYKHKKLFVKHNYLYNFIINILQRREQTRFFIYSEKKKWHIECLRGYR